MTIMVVKMPNAQLIMINEKQRKILLELVKQYNHLYQSEWTCGSFTDELYSDVSRFTNAYRI